MGTNDYLVEPKFKFTPAASDRDAEDMTLRFYADLATDPNASIMRQPIQVAKVWPSMDDYSDEERSRRINLSRASVHTLLSTEIEKLEPTAQRALYSNVTANLLNGIRDEDGKLFFGKKASQNPLENLKLLRRFVKGEWDLIQDDEYLEWKKLDEQAKFEYALKHESKWNRFASDMKGERGASIWEWFAVAASKDDGPNPFQTKEETAFKDDVVRRSRYSTMTSEEQAKVRADVIGDYDNKLSKRQVFATYLSFTQGLSDRASWYLAKSFSDGKIDEANVITLPPDERRKVLAAFKLMSGDKKNVSIFGLFDADISTGTYGDRVQMALYGLGNAVKSLVTDTYEVGVSIKEAIQVHNMEDRAEQRMLRDAIDFTQQVLIAETKDLPEGSFGGQMVQGVAENVHWVIPYMGATSGSGMMKATTGIGKGVGLWGKTKDLAKTFWIVKPGSTVAAQRVARFEKGLENATRASAAYHDAFRMSRGALEADTYVAYQADSIRRLRDGLTKARAALKAETFKDGLGMALWASSNASLTCSFAKEYIDNAVAAGAPWEEAVFTSAAIGWINGRIENLYVFGGKTGLSSPELSSISARAMANACSKNGEGLVSFLRRWATLPLAERAKVFVEEGFIEEPIQQFFIDLGSEFAKGAKEKGFSDSICEAIKKEFEDGKAFKDYINVSLDTLPTSVGFALNNVNMARIHKAIEQRFYRSQCDMAWDEFKARHRQNFDTLETIRQEAYSDDHDGNMDGFVPNQYVEPVRPSFQIDEEGRNIGYNSDLGLAEAITQRIRTTDAIREVLEGQDDESDAKSDGTGGSHTGESNESSGKKDGTVSTDEDADLSIDPEEKTKKAIDDVVGSVTGEETSNDGKSGSNEIDHSRRIKLQQDANDLMNVGRTVYDNGGAVSDIAEKMGIDIKLAEAVVSTFEIEDAARMGSINAGSIIDSFVKANANQAILEAIPGVVKGSYREDKETGDKIVDIEDGNVPGGKRTLIIRNGSPFVNSDGTINEENLSDATIIHEGGKKGRLYLEIQESYDSRYGAGAWDKLSTEQRRRIAISGQTGYTSMEDVVESEYKDSNGNVVKVKTPLKFIVYLSQGRIAVDANDILGVQTEYKTALATQKTLNHELYGHVMWQLCRTGLTIDKVRNLAKHLGIDTDDKSNPQWEVELDERMAKEIESYYSGMSVFGPVQELIEESQRRSKTFVGKVEKIVSGALKLAGFGEKVVNPDTGKAYDLSDLYDAVITGRLGSGAMGIEFTTNTESSQSVSNGDQQSTSPSKSSIPVQDEEATPQTEERGDKNEESTQKTAKSNRPDGSKQTGIEYTSDNPASPEIPNARFYRIQADSEGNVFLVGELEVVNANESITSYNEGYSDPELQNRNTGTEDSLAAAEKIAENLDPRQTSLVSPRANNGIKWVTPSGMVFIGNTRARGEQLAYERGKGGELAAFVRSQAAIHGISIPDGVSNPTLRFRLIRIESVNGNQVSMRDVVRMTNENQQRGMDELEQASNDAQIVEKEGIAQDLAFRPDGRIDETKSGDAIGKFRRATGMQGMVGEDGMLTESGEKRLTSAILANLIGVDARRRPLLQKILRDASKLDMRNQIRALVKVAPIVMATADAQKLYDITQDIADAIQMFVEWRDVDEALRVEKGKTRHDWREVGSDGRRKRGISWERHIGQGNMFERPSEAASIIADLLAASESVRSFDREDIESEVGKKRSVDLIVNYIEDYARNASAASPDVDMFGEPGTTKEQMLKVQREKSVDGSGMHRFSTPGLFVDPDTLPFEERNEYYQRLAAESARREDPSWTKVLTEDEWKRAEDILGVVDNISHATYIAPDGKLLGSAGSSDHIEHGAIVNAVIRPTIVRGRVLTRKDGTVIPSMDRAVRAAIKSGAIRLDSGHRGFQVEAKKELSKEQIDKIYDYVEWANGESGPNGFFVDYAENGIADILTPSAYYRKGTKAFAVLSDLREYRENGVLPSGNEANYGRLMIENLLKSKMDLFEDGRFSIRTLPPPEKTGRGYKVFVRKADGKLYPPMVANPNGEATPIGVWLDADEGVRAGVSKTGRPKVKAGGKGTNGGGGTLSFRPGWHLGEIPYALQFNVGEKVPNPLGIKNKKGEVIEVGRYFPGNFVWAEVEYADDVSYQEEADSYGKTKNGFNHALAGLPRMPVNGSYTYRTNANPATDPWIITGAMKVNRVLSDSEVDQIVESAGRKPQEREPKGRFTINIGLNGAEKLDGVAYGAYQAMMMTGAREDRRKVWQNTGWWKGVDGKWRTSISSGSIKEGFEKAKKLGDILDAPVLYLAYPKLSEVKVSFRKLTSGTLGIFDDNKIILDLKQIKAGTGSFLESLVESEKARIESARKYLDKKYVSDDIDLSNEFNSIIESSNNKIKELKIKIENGFADRVLETIVHEIQHYAQMKEGFARGSSVDFEGIIVQRRIEEIEERRGDLMYLLSELYKVKEEDRNSAKERLEKEMKELSYELSILEKAHEDGTLYRRYYRSAGESEARYSADHRNADANDRTGLAPWEWYSSGIPGAVPEADQIVRFSIEMSNLQPVTSEEIDNIKHYFGTTDNAFEAAYILPDGSMLDFSGSNFGGPKGVRTVDHRDIEEAINRGGRNRAMYTVQESGFIRLFPEMPGCEIVVNPTDDALWTLREAFDQLKNRTDSIDDFFTVEYRVPYIENGERTGYSIYRQSRYSFDTDPRRIANDIKNFFRTGEVSEGTAGRFSTQVGDAFGNRRFMSDIVEHKRIIASSKTSKDGLYKMSRPGFLVQPWSYSECAGDVRDVTTYNQESGKPVYDETKISERLKDYGNDEVSNVARIVSQILDYSEDVKRKAAHDFFASRNGRNESARKNVNKLLKPFIMEIEKLKQLGKKVVIKPVVTPVERRKNAVNEMYDRQSGRFKYWSLESRYDWDHALKMADPFTYEFGIALEEETGAEFDQTVVSYYTGEDESVTGYLLSKTETGMNTGDNDAVILVQGIASDGRDIYASIFNPEYASNIFVFARRDTQNIKLYPNDAVVKRDGSIEVLSKTNGDLRSIIANLTGGKFSDAKQKDGFNEFIEEISRCCPGAIFQNEGEVTVDSVWGYVEREESKKFLRSLLPTTEEIFEDDINAAEYADYLSGKDEIERKFKSNKRAMRSSSLPFFFFNSGARDAKPGKRYNKVIYPTNMLGLSGSKGAIGKLRDLKSIISLWGYNEEGFLQAYRYLQKELSNGMKRQAYNYLMGKAMWWGNYKEEAEACAKDAIESVLKKQFVREIVDSLWPNMPVKIVYPQHRNSTNVIPKVFSEILAERIGVNPEESIVNDIFDVSNEHSFVSGDHNGDSNLMFSGMIKGVEKGDIVQAQVIILDDIYTTGNSIVSLMDHLVKTHGESIEISAIGTLAASRFGSEVFVTEEDLTEAAKNDNINLEAFKKALPYDYRKLLRSELSTIRSGWRDLLSELGLNESFGGLQYRSGKVDQKLEADTRDAEKGSSEVGDPGELVKEEGVNSDKSKSSDGFNGRMSVSPEDLISAKIIDGRSSPRFSILNRQIIWGSLPDSLDTVFNSTSLAHLESADRNKPARDYFYKLMGPRGMWGSDNPRAYEYAVKLSNQIGTEWLGKYLLAKHFGDDKSALQIVKHFLKPGIVNAIRNARNPEKALRIVYIHSQEGTSLNRIPLAYAALLNSSIGENTKIDNGVVKISQEQNTRAEQKDRVARDFLFESEDGIDKSAQYLIVDDTWTSGQTSVSMLDYLQSEGADTIGITTLATGRYGKRIKPTNDQLKRAVIKAKLSTLEEANKLLGFDLGKATGSELHGYILQGKSGPSGLQGWFSEVNSPMLPGILPSSRRSDDVDRSNVEDDQGRPGASTKGLTGNGLQPTYNGQMTLPGFGRFSQAYPLLNTLSDDELLTAAIASRVALGRSDKRTNAIRISAVRKQVEKLHPEYNSQKAGVETQRIINEAWKLSKRMRDDIERGVANSEILAHLPKMYHSVFHEELKNARLTGRAVGTYGLRAEEKVKAAQAKVVEDAVAVQTGVETKVLENKYGIDLSATLMNLSENPLKKDSLSARGNDSSESSSGEDFDQDSGSIPTEDLDTKVNEAIASIVESTRAQSEDDNKKRDESRARSEEEDRLAAELSDGDEEGVGSGISELTQDDLVSIAARKSKVDLNDPRHLARFIEALARRYWNETHNISLNTIPWGNAVALQFLRKTAQNVYTKLVQDLTYSGGRETAIEHIRKLSLYPTERGLLSEMEFIGALINSRRIWEKQEELCKKLDLFLRTEVGASGRFKPDDENIKRKVSAEIELRARYLRHAMWLTPAAVAEESQQLQDELNRVASEFDAEGRDKDQSRIMVETIRKLGILREYGGLRYKPIAQIQAAIDQWTDIANGSKDELLQAAEERELQTTRAAQILAVAFTNAAEKYSKKGGSELNLSNYITSHMGFINFLRDLARFSSGHERDAANAVIDYISLEVQKAGDKSMAEKTNQDNEFYRAVREIYGKDFKEVLKGMNKVDERFEKFMGSSEGGKIDIPTKGRAMQLLVSLLQEGHIAGMDDDGNEIWVGGYHDNIILHKRQGQAAQIKSLLTTQDLNLISWIGRWYERNRQELSDISESLFGIGVYAESATYFPVKMRLDPKGLESVSGVSWTIFPKALTPRVRNLRDFDTSADIFSMWRSRMEEAAQWKAHAKLGLEMRGIFGRSVLQGAVKSNHGQKAKDLMLGFVTDILVGHGAYDRSTEGVEYFADQIRGWAALCALGGNIGVMLKQTTSIPAFGFEIGLANTARHIVTAFTPDGIEAMRKIFNSQQRKTRWGVGNSEVVANALQSTDAGLIKKIFQASMFTNRLGDVVPALIVGQGIFRDLVDKGMSEEDAMAGTWLLVERTQQSSRIENQASFQRRNKLGRTLYQFLSTQQQFLQYEVSAIRSVIANPKDASRWGKLGTAFTLNHIILSSLYYWMGELYKAMLGQEPPEDQLTNWITTCLLGPFGALFVAGFMCTSTLDLIFKGKKGAFNKKEAMSSLSFAQTQAEDIYTIIDTIVSSEKSAQDVVDSIIKWASDSNAAARDINKVYKFRIVGDDGKDESTRSGRGRRTDRSRKSRSNSK